MLLFVRALTGHLTRQIAPPLTEARFGLSLTAMLPFVEHVLMAALEVEGNLSLQRRPDSGHGGHGPHLAPRGFSIFLESLALQNETCLDSLCTQGLCLYIFGRQVLCGRIYDIFHGMLYTLGLFDVCQRGALHYSQWTDLQGASRWN